MDNIFGAENWIMLSVVLLTNPEWSIVRIKRNDDSHSGSTRTQSWCYNQSNFSVKDFPLCWRTNLSHRQLFQPTNKSILVNGPWAGGLSFEKHETSLYLLTSESQRFVIETADDWTGPVHEQGMVLVVCKQTSRPNHSCICTSTYDELE